jgi:TP901 family phage tail tape measure protein
MSTIGFDDLFNKSDFNSGLEALKNAIAAITKEIESTKTAADGFSKTMGEELKNKINQLSSASSNFDTELKKVRADFEAFKQSVGQTNATLDQYKKTNEDLTNKVKNLEEQTKKYTEAQKGASKAASDGGVTMKGLSQQLLGVASGAALVYRGITMLKEQLVNAIKSTREFETAMKAVEAITRASGAELLLLTNNANRLGATTEKTATQIAQLQKELGKLGFNTSEILASTDAIVDLSTATGEGLAQSATVAAATLRAFGLDAAEMSRVVDVMAGSFVRSGLDLEKFREAMKLVAPIARATNIDIETTTASLSKLADAGLSGSLAGTALRNLFSSMADPTDKLSKFLGYTVKNSDDLVKAFKDLRDRGVDLAQAVQMVDVRARPAFFTLLNQVDAVEALALEYKILDGEANNIAETMRDILDNDIKIAASAFDALSRNIVEKAIPAARRFTQNATIMSEALRFVIDDIYNLMKADKEFGETDFTISNVVKDLIPFFRQFEDVFDEMGKAVSFRKGREELNSTNLTLSTLDKELDKIRPKLSTFEALNKLIKDAGDSEDGFGGITETLQSFGDEYKNILEKLNTGVITEKEATRALRDRLQISLQSTKSSIEQQENLVESLRKEYRLRVEKFGVAEADTEEMDKQKTLLDQIKSIEDFLTKNRYDQALLERSIKKEKLGTKQTLEEIEAAEKARLEYQKEQERLLKEEIKLNQALIDVKIKENQAEQDKLNIAIKYEKDLLTRVSMENKLAALQINNANLVKDKQLEGLRAYVQGSKIHTAEVEKVMIDHNSKLETISSDFWMSTMTKLQKSFDTRFKEIVKGSQKVVEDSMKAESDKNKDKGEKDLKDEARIDREKAMLYAQSIQAARRAFDTFFDYRKSKRDEELEALNRWEEERIKLAGDNQEAIAAIREEAELRRKAIMRKQARDEKAAAMFNIALNTAQAIVAALKLGPPGVILAIAIGAIGAAQLALVASKKTPQFAKGTTNAPEGQAIVGEKGREIVWDKRSNTTYVTPDAPTLTYLSKGSVVIPNDQTERILSTKVDRNEIAYDKTTISNNRKKEGADLYKLGGMFKEAVREIPLHQTTFDADGVREFVKRGNNRTERLNRRYKY